MDYTEHARKYPTTRMKAETYKAYEAFRKFLEMGHQRTLRSAASTLNKSPSLLYRWSRRFSWQERLLTYADEQTACIAQAEAQAALEGARLRQQRRDQIEEQMWEAAQALYAKVVEMLKFPVVEKRVIHGPKGDTIIIKPGKWSWADLIRVLGAIKELGTYAAGLPSRRGDVHEREDRDLVADETLRQPPLPQLVHVVIKHEQRAEFLQAECQSKRSEIPPKGIVHFSRSAPSKSA
jgi:transposase-like protein